VSSALLAFSFFEEIRQFLDRTQDAMNTVMDAIFQTSVIESADVPATTFQHVVNRCDISWNSTYRKFQRDIENINSDLSPDLKFIMEQQKTLATIVRLLSTAKNTPSRLHSMICLEKQNRETACRINDSIKAVPEWSVVPQALHDGLSAWATALEKQKIDVALMYLALGDIHNGMK